MPEKNYDKDKEWLIYAEEADLLNVALFNCTAKDWRDANFDKAKKGLNIRDFASINELVVLSNLENLNSILIRNQYKAITQKHKLINNPRKQKTRMNVNTDLVRDKIFSV